MKEQRLNFSDYSAAEQEADVKKHLAKASKTIRHAYILKVDGEWAHFIVNEKADNYAFYGKANLFDVYNSIKEDYPNHKPRVIINEGLTEYLRLRKKQAEMIKAKQLTLFNEGK